MIKIRGIIYFPIWLTSGLLKKSQKWFVFNCRASLEKMNYVPMWKGAFQVDSASFGSPGSLWWIPCWAFWEYPHRENHSLCHPRIQIQGVLVNRVSEMPPKEQYVPSQKNRRLEHLRRKNGDGSIWGNSKAVLTSHSYHTPHVANLNSN